MTDSASVPHSQALFDRATRVIPGGVSSPVRAYRAVGGTPRFIARGEGQWLVDEDGQRYLDLVQSWGPLMLGHAHPEVVAAITERVRLGTTFGAPCAQEVALAEALVTRYPGLEQVRFVSSGTEATMSAIRVARAATGRDVIVKFSGCYHGHADHLLVAAGSGLATFGQPSSAGVPAAFVGATRVLPLDDDAALRELFRTEGSQIAAVIIEPLPANHGLMPQRREYLELLREETRRAGTLLIFDEVISGFRIARGGAAELYGITPDLVTFGKVIGGGMPAGAFGGTRKVMSRLAPLGDTYQAGTLSGNPVAMASGLTTLSILDREDAWKRLEALGAELDTLLAPVLAAAPFPIGYVRVGSLFWLAIGQPEIPRASTTLAPADTERFRVLFHAMLERGVYLPPSPYECCFLSLAHRSADLAQFATALAESIAVAGAEAA